MYHGDKPDIASYLPSILKIAEDGQAIYEFLQNAADCGSTHFYIFYNEKYFLAINNGSPFDVEGLQSILNIAQTTKKDPDKIDTNVFVDCPDIISRIDKNYQVILSAKVIDELDYLKISLSDEQKKNVQKALKQINESIDKRGIKMNIADLTLLPNDFNKKSPDNLILSVALKYKDENPIMMTSDNGLQIKAKGLDITTITLREFLRQIKH